MSADRQWALDQVRTQLVAAELTHDTVSLETLREEVGIGHEDLMAALDQLREKGEAHEVTPGDWTGGTEEAAAERAGEPPPPPPATPGTENVGRRAPAAEGAGEVVLTMAVASALDAETIGKLVEAGIAEAKAGDRAFVLRVEP